MQRKLILATSLVLVLLATPSTAQVLKPLFGSTVQSSWHVPTYPWLSHNNLSRYLMRTIQETNSGAVRLLFPWRSMELSEGNIDFSVQDIYVAEAKAHDLKIMTMFYGIPAWSNGSSPSCSFWSQSCSQQPSSPDHFYNFVKAVAERYGDDIDVWEFWNEPDLNTFWSGAGMYILEDKIITPGYQAVIDTPGTNHVFVTPAVSFSSVKMKAILNATGHIPWAYVGVHLFPGGAPSPYTWSVNKMTEYSNARAQANHHTNVPFYITEAAIGTGEGYTATQMVDLACKWIQDVRTHGTSGPMRADKVNLFFPWDPHGETKFNGITTTERDKKPVYDEMQFQIDLAKPFRACGNSV